MNKEKIRDFDLLLAGVVGSISTLLSTTIYNNGGLADNQTEISKGLIKQLEEMETLLEKEYNSREKELDDGQD